ncbi:hypothetical protein Pla110_24610 [Polystyrenella longa]|uniref:GYF domain-containing protein n=1 Tax=Polystyrenella longa TaxID=2528007 RepID=A0A518CNE0_9PLAN|nr:hypothetical protein [Polystyrenella longa]QDU80728.1 hypothetical protein Pla110_24610 [Polystyrenella longa]
MRDEFYVKESTGTFGPVTFAKLVELIRAGRFTLQHSIKQGRDGKWIAAESVMRSLKHRYPELVQADIPKDQVSKSVPEEEQFPHQVKTPPIHRVSQQKSASSLTYKLWDLQDGCATVLRSKVTWGIAVLLVWASMNLYYYQKSANPYATEKAYFQTYSQIWDESKTLRAAKADKAKWAEFESRVLPQIQIIAAELDETATPSNQLQMQLLWLGQEHLPNAIRSANAERNDAAKLVESHLNQAERLLIGAGVDLASL